ncbi:GNAT family N-acetyltransferase [Micrococcaceae bacterium Sec5.7]
MTLTPLTITAVVIPESLDAGSAGKAGSSGISAEGNGTDFRDCCSLQDAHQMELWGNLDRCATVQERLQFWRGNGYEERQLFIARVGGEPVGRCSVTLPLQENTATAGIDVLVASAHRRQGIGRRLLDFAEEVGRGRRRTIFDADCEEPAGRVAEADELLPAKSGTGGVPKSAPSTAFAVNAGYQLEQVETSSSLPLPVAPEHLDALEEAAKAESQDYVLVEWKDSCPEELVDAYAALKSRMGTDLPMAGLEWEAEDWDAARVRDEEQTWGKSGIESLVAAARRRDTGELAAYSALNRRPARPRILSQEDTLVVGEHRGHRLGMLIKIANIRRAQKDWPAGQSVCTWNASENRHMLAINISLGFRPSGYEGEWQKRLE